MQTFQTEWPARGTGVKKGLCLVKQLLVHLDKCTGCRNCLVACAVEHSQSKNLLRAMAEVPPPQHRLFLERADGKHIPITCRHCDPAPCVDGCIAGSMQRDERGYVVQQPEQCVGCWTCIMLCPYGVIDRNAERDAERRFAIKCDGCPERDVPACVGACAEETCALVFEEIDEFTSETRRVLAGVIVKATK